MLPIYVQVSILIFEPNDQFFLSLVQVLHHWKPPQWHTF